MSKYVLMLDRLDQAINKSSLQSQHYNAHHSIMLVLKCTILSKNLLELLLSLTFYSLPKEKISQLHVHHIHFTRLLLALLKKIKMLFFSPSNLHSVTDVTECKFSCSKSDVFCLLLVWFFFKLQILLFFFPLIYRALRQISEAKYNSYKNVCMLCQIKYLPSLLASLCQYPMEDIYRGV